MDSQGAFIQAIGLVTPVGIGTAQTATSVRAGLSAYEESPIINKRYKPMTLALIPEDVLPPLAEAGLPTSLTTRQGRMLRITHLALNEIAAQIPPETRVPLFLALPETLPNQRPPIDDSFLDHLITQSGAPIDRAHSAIFPVGRAGVFQALKAALATLEEGRVAYVLVGGVDSHLDLYLLATLDMENRVMAEGVTDGFVPGEGAGFFLLSKEKADHSLDNSQESSETTRQYIPLLLGEDVPKGQVRGGSVAEPNKLEFPIWISIPGIGIEPGHRFSDQPYRGEGLSKAVATAVSMRGKSPVKTVLTGMNGENMGAKEWGVAYLRSQTAFDPECRTNHPADCYGDLGAATGAALIGLAATSLSQNHDAGPCLVWAASDAEHRGAVCLTTKGE